MTYRNVHEVIKNYKQTRTSKIEDQQFFFIYILGTIIMHLNILIHRKE